MRPQGASAKSGKPRQAGETASDDDDLDLVAERGTCICHNPSSNLRLGSGVAPCAHFLKRAIPIAIGIDEAGLNDVLRSMQELVSRTAMLVAYHETGAADCGCAEHRSIVRAIRTRDAGLAGREMQLHLSLVETRLQAPPVRPSTSDIEAVLAKEIRRWTASRKGVDKTGPLRPRRAATEPRRDGAATLVHRKLI